MSVTSSKNAKMMTRFCGEASSRKLHFEEEDAQYPEDEHICKAAH